MRVGGLDIFRAIAKSISHSYTSKMMPPSSAQEGLLPPAADTISTAVLPSATSPPSHTATQCTPFLSSHPPTALASVPISPISSATPLLTAHAEGTRFVPNKVERSWLISTLTAFRAPLHKMKTLEGTCRTVADRARTRHIPDAEIIAEQERYGMSWRRTYMKRVTAANVIYLANIVAKLAKNVPVASGSSSDIGPIAGVRAGCAEGGVQQLFDQAVLEYKTKAAERTQTTEDDAAKALSKQQQSRREKRERLEKQKSEYASKKKKKGEEKERREREKHSKELQNVKALTLTANAAAESTQIQRRQSEQMNIFLALYAERHSLTPRHTTTPIPAPLSSTSIEIDPSLISRSTGTKPASADETTGTREGSVEAGASSAVADETVSQANQNTEE